MTVRGDTTRTRKRSENPPSVAGLVTGDVDRLVILPAETGQVEAQACRVRSVLDWTSIRTRNTIGGKEMRCGNGSVLAIHGVKASTGLDLRPEALVSGTEAEQHLH